MMRTGPPPPEDLTQQADEEEEERLKRAAEAVDAAEDKMGIFFFGRELRKRWVFFFLGRG
jgi:hypothetical protein